MKKNRFAVKNVATGDYIKIPCSGEILGFQNLKEAAYWLYEDIDLKRPDWQVGWMWKTHGNDTLEIVHANGKTIKSLVPDREECGYED